MGKKAESSEGCAEILRALGDATRLSVLQALLEGPAHVHDLLKRVTVGQSLLSDHLKVLRDAGLVLAKRDGKAVLYCRHRREHIPDSPANGGPLALLEMLLLGWIYFGRSRILSSWAQTDVMK